MRLAKIAPVALAVLLLAGCATATPRPETAATAWRSVEAHTLRTLEAVDLLRKETLRAAVRANVAGTLSDAQFEVIAQRGRELDVAELAAGRALELWLLSAKAGLPASTGDLDVAMAAVDLAKMALLGGGT